MKKFIIKTLGCKTNQAESALIAEILLENGFAETRLISEADYYILNSCSVTHTADEKNLSYLRRAKHENKNIITVLTGCMAQLEKDRLIKNNTADYVIGNYEKNDIAEILNSEKKCCVSDIFSHSDFRYKKLRRIDKTRAFIKIQDGCNNRCAYCTIPYARGINRSDLIEHIIEQINSAAAQGYYEAVLTGIHIGQWGADFTPQKKLLNLIEEIEKTNIHRYRLGSLNPLELTEDFIDFLAQSKKFCPHFHLSLQSVCDKTLAAMNRRYSADKIKSLCSCINDKFKNAFTGCDIIAGFPGETEKDFQITAENLSDLKLSKMHIFPYSKRSGTIAANMPSQIDEFEKKRRCRILKQISDKKHHDFLLSNIGLKHEIIIEKTPQKNSRLLKGLTKNYISVLIENKADLAETMQTAVITGFFDDGCEKGGNSEKMRAEIVL